MNSPPLSGGKRKLGEIDLLEAARASARALVSKFEPAKQAASAYASYASTYGASLTPHAYGYAPPVSDSTWTAAAAAAGPQVVQSYTRERVGRIIGPGGCNITVIRKESGAKIKIDSNCVAGHQQVTYSGTDAEIQAAIALVERLLATPDLGGQGEAADGAPRAEHKQELDKESAGKVIGQGGATIKNIRESSGAYIKISNEKIPGVETQTLTVGGTEEQVAAAMSLVNEALQRPSLPPKTPDAPAASEVSHMLPEAIAAKVIGPGGQNVRRVRESTGAKIKIGNDRTGEPGQLFQELNLSGSEEQVAAALAMINEIIANDAGPDKSASPRNGEQTVTCHVPLGVAGRIIGPKGATVKTIREQSGARIKIHNTTGPSATSQAVDITGPEQGCRIAYAMVMEIASAPASTPRVHGGPPSAHRGPPPPHLAPPPYQPPPHQPYAYPPHTMPAPAHPGYGYDASGYGAPPPPSAYGPPPAYGAPPPQHHYAPPPPQQHGYAPPSHAYQQQPASAYAPPRPMYSCSPSGMPPQSMFGQPTGARPAAAKAAMQPQGYGSHAGDGAVENGGYAAGLQAGMAAILQGHLPPELAAMFAHQQAGMQHGAPPAQAALSQQHEPLA